MGPGGSHPLFFIPPIVESTLKASKQLMFN
jgi:hypothetical protein